MNYEFGTILAEQFDDKDVDRFTNYFDNVWISKETFTVRFDTKDIELYLFIEYIDMSEYTEDTKTQEVSIGIIPSYNSLVDKYKDSILNQYTIEEIERLKTNPSEMAYNILLYGLNIPLLIETTQDRNEIDHLIKSAIAVSYGMSSLIGFYLDRTLNMVGNTGWDLLINYCDC